MVSARSNATCSISWRRDRSPLAVSPLPRDGPVSCDGCGPSRPAARSRWIGRCSRASGGPRYERWIELTPEGRRGGSDARGRRTVARTTAGPTAGRRPRRAGRRRSAERRACRRRAMPGAELAARHGSSAIAGLVRRGLVASEIRERPRRPLAGRPAGRRGGRPASVGSPAGPGRGRRGRSGAR